MVVTYTQEHVYHHPWDRVTAAAFLKFTSPLSSSLPHIVDVHTLSPRLDPVHGLLSCTRSISIRSPPLPPLLRRLAPSPTILCLEISSVDPVHRCMEVRCRNITFRGLIEVEERGVYWPHDERPEQWTAFRQETRIRCKGVTAVAKGLAGKVEERCAERFRQNSVKGREIIERICCEQLSNDSLE